MDSTVSYAKQGPSLIPKAKKQYVRAKKYANLNSIKFKRQTRQTAASEVKTEEAVALSPAEAKAERKRLRRLEKKRLRERQIKKQQAERRRNRYSSKDKASEERTAQAQRTTQTYRTAQLKLEQNVLVAAGLAAPEDTDDVRLHQHPARLGYGMQRLSFDSSTQSPAFFGMRYHKTPQLESTRYVHPADSHPALWSFYGCPFLPQNDPTRVSPVVFGFHPTTALRSVRGRNAADPATGEVGTGCHMAGCECLLPRTSSVVAAGMCRACGHTAVHHSFHAQHSAGWLPLPVQGHRHPAFHGLSVRRSRHADSAMAHPVFHGFALVEDIAATGDDDKVGAGGGGDRAAAARDMDEWSDDEGGPKPCPICRRHMAGCPACYSMPTIGEALEAAEARKLADIPMTSEFDLPRGHPEARAEAEGSPLSPASRRRAQRKQHKKRLATRSLAAAAVGDGPSQPSGKLTMLQRVAAAQQRARGRQIALEAMMHTTLMDSHALAAHRHNHLTFVHLYAKTLPAGDVVRVTVEAQDTVRYALFLLRLNSSVTRNYPRWQAVIPTMDGMLFLDPTRAPAADLLNQFSPGDFPLRTYGLACGNSIDPTESAVLLRLPSLNDSRAPRMVRAFARQNLMMREPFSTAVLRGYQHLPERLPGADRLQQLMLVLMRDNLALQERRREEEVADLVARHQEKIKSAMTKRKMERLKEMRAMRVNRKLRLEAEAAQRLAEARLELEKMRHGSGGGQQHAQLKDEADIDGEATNQEPSLGALPTGAVGERVVLPPIL